MRYELKSIGIWPFIKIAFAVNLLAGFIAGLFSVPMAAVFMAAMETASYSDPDIFAPDEAMVGPVLMGVPVILALGAALLGTFFQTVVVLIYNLMARLVGGFELTLVPVASPDLNYAPMRPSGPTRPAEATPVAAPVAPGEYPAPPPPPGSGPAGTSKSVPPPAPASPSPEATPTPPPPVDGDMEKS